MSTATRLKSTRYTVSMPKFALCRAVSGEFDCCGYIYFAYNTKEDTVTRWVHREPLEEDNGLQEDTQGFVHIELETMPWDKFLSDRLGIALVA